MFDVKMMLEFEVSKFENHLQRMCQRLTFPG